MGTGDATNLPRIKVTLTKTSHKNHSPDGSTKRSNTFTRTTLTPSNTSQPSAICPRLLGRNLTNSDAELLTTTKPDVVVASPTLPLWSAITAHKVTWKVTVPPCTRRATPAPAAPPTSSTATTTASVARRVHNVLMSSHHFHWLFNWF